MKGRDAGDLQCFTDLLMAGLKDGGVKSDTEFCFDASAGSSKLSVSINGVPKGTINSPTLTTGRDIQDWASITFVILIHVYVLISTN
jgi:hypothetical protein